MGGKGKEEPFTHPPLWSYEWHTRGRRKESRYDNKTAQKVLKTPKLILNNNNNNNNQV